MNKNEAQNGEHHRKGVTLFVLFFMKIWKEVEK